jgi:drug/metabolite transporter (DMT)-like permease
MLRTKNFQPYAASIATSFIFGLSFIFSKVALAITDPITLLSFRFLTAFLIMSVLLLIGVIKINYRNKPILSLLLLGIIQPVLYFIFETYGIKYSSASMAGLMIALIPILVTILGGYFLKEKPSLIQMLFIVLSVSGVAFIVVMNNSGGKAASSIGILILLGAVTSAAFFNILSRKLSTSFTPMELTYFMMGIAALLFNIISIFNHAVSKSLNSYFSVLQNKNFIIAILYLGILSSIIAFFLTNFTLSKIEASRSAVFSNLSTIVSIIGGVVFLKEHFYFYHIIGSILILTGVWGTNHFRNSNNSINKSLNQKLKF